MIKDRIFKISLRLDNEINKNGFYELKCNMPIDSEVINVCTQSLARSNYLNIFYSSDSNKAFYERDILIVKDKSPKLNGYTFIQSVLINDARYFVYLKTLYFAYNNDDNPSDVDYEIEVLHNLSDYVDKLDLGNFTKYNPEVHKTSSDLKELSETWNNELMVNRVIEILSSITNIIPTSYTESEDINEYTYEDKHIKISRISYQIAYPEFVVYWKHLGKNLCVLKSFSAVKDEIDSINFVPNSWINYLKKLGQITCQKINYDKGENKTSLFSEEDIYQCLLGKVLYNNI